MNIGTGQTVYEQILSVDVDNNPITATTFDIATYRDNILYTGITVGVTLSDATRGVFTAEWSASTTGDYQMYAKNNVTSVIFISDSVIVIPDSEISTNVYIGL
jgi:hypothetical protein